MNSQFNTIEFNVVYLKLFEIMNRVATKIDNYSSELNESYV